MDYFQPCLQALVRSQVNFYGESNGLFTHLVSTTSEKDEANDVAEGGQERTVKSSKLVPKVTSDKTFHEDLDKQLSALRSLSIVGK